MKTQLILGLVAALGPPLVAALAGLVVSRFGIAGKAREIEYRLKRFQLVQAMKKLQDAGFGKHDWSILDQELADLLSFVRLTSTAEVERSEERIRPRARLMRAIILPRPRTVGGWIATVIYYLYGFSAIVYVAVGVGVFFGASLNSDIKGLLLPGIIAAALLAVTGRHYAVRSLQRATNPAGGNPKV